MRRILVAAVCAVFVMILAVPTLAAGQLQFAVTPSVTQAAPGDKVVFEVSVKGDAYSAVGYIPTYDKTVWEYREGECVAEESALDDFSENDGGILALRKAAVSNGNIFRFTLEVKSDAPTGQTTLTGDVSARDNDGIMNTALTDTVVNIQPQNLLEPAQTEATKPVEQTSPTQSVEETFATEQTQPVPPDSTAVSTQPTTSSQATDPTQAMATEDNRPTGETDPGKDSTLTIGQGTVPELGGENGDLDGEEEAVQVADPVPKGNDTLLVWTAAISVVAAAAAAVWFFLRKKEIE